MSAFDPLLEVVLSPGTDTFVWCLIEAKSGWKATSQEARRSFLAKSIFGR
jgi:hypothetical protein